MDGYEDVARKAENAGAPRSVPGRAGAGQEPIVRQRLTEPCRSLARTSDGFLSADMGLRLSRVGVCPHRSGTEELWQRKDRAASGSSLVLRLAQWSRDAPPTSPCAWAPEGSGSGAKNQLRTLANNRPLPCILQTF